MGRLGVKAPTASNVWKMFTGKEERKEGRKEIAPLLTTTQLAPRALILSTQALILSTRALVLSTQALVWRWGLTGRR